MSATQSHQSDADLEAAFAQEVGDADYQRLLDEKWLPFQGVQHLKMSSEDAVKREVQAAREFLGAL